MPQPYIWMGAAVLGMFAAIAGAIIAMQRRQPNDHHRRIIRTCCICGQRISENPYVSVCGHQFHRNCYADKLLNHRDRGEGSHMPCPSCGHTTRNEESPSEGMRRRTTSRRDSGATPTSSRNNNGSSDANKSCGFCSRILKELVEEVDKLSCGHMAHHNCRIRMKDITRCIHCVSRGSAENSKCGNCDMPFITSDTDKIKRDCGHFIHNQCSSISQFMECTNCRRDNEARQ